MTENVELGDDKGLTNRDLKITLIRGGAIETIGPFNVTWNYGLREFLEAYENFLLTGTQTEFRFKMHPDPKTSGTTLLLKFQDVIAVSSVY